MTGNFDYLWGLPSIDHHPEMHPVLRGACGRGDLAYTELCRGHVLGVTGKSIPRKC